jgi:hypothetical protein
MRELSLIVLLSLALATGLTRAGLKSLPEVDLSQLSQRDPNPLGEKALGIHPEQWKHAETEHFIYHFVHGYVATPVSVEAEYYYRVVVKDLRREAPPSETKSNIYIFEHPEDWREFQGLGELEPWTGGIHSQGSLFIVRNPAYKFSDNSLGHEIVHLVVHRFYPEGVPCWLNEGLAQYISKSAHASFERARGYRARPRSDSISATDLISLSDLLSTTRPPSDRVETFYDESERLVRFLRATNWEAFLALIDDLGHHQPADRALLTRYQAQFSSLALLEQQFRNYASQDFSLETIATGGN